MSIDDKRRVASAAFIVLLTLSVFWPEPVVDTNRICCSASLAVDDLSFLGREAPSWDVVYWCVAGLFLLALLQPGGDFRDVATHAKHVRIHFSRNVAVSLFAAAAIVAAVWRWADAPLMAWSEQVESDRVDGFIRYANRFGGGMNPLMIVAFFVLAGVAYRARHWIAYGIAMAVAGAAAGILVQVVKFAVGRTRPELWLGPFHHARASASSFPSGHTVGAFALAGVLMLNGRSVRLRVAAALLAIFVAVSRVLAFRHWPSDVVASALIGLIVAWVTTVTPVESTDIHNPLH